MAMLYQAADTYVSPYRAEGFNLPVLEAAACGIPIICTRGGSTDDFVTDDFARRIESRKVSSQLNDQEIWRLEPDLEHLIALMVSAIEDAAWRKRAGEAGPLHAAANYTWDCAVDQLIRNYGPRNDRAIGGIPAHQGCRFRDVRRCFRYRIARRAPSRRISNQFPAADIVAVECNRDTLERCRRNFAQKPRIRLIDKAINSIPGAALSTPSIRRDPSPAGRRQSRRQLPFHRQRRLSGRDLCSNKVEVDCIRLDDLCAELHVDAIDLIWMDLQGAELLALQSAGALLEKVRYIYTKFRLGRFTRTNVCSMTSRHS